LQMMWSYTRKILKTVPKIPDPINTFSKLAGYKNILHFYAQTMNSLRKKSGD
jgi:hypothetical protein